MSPRIACWGLAIACWSLAIACWSLRIVLVACSQALCAAADVNSNTLTITGPAAAPFTALYHMYICI